MNKRGVATKIASRTGALRVLERLGRRPALVVLVYHRILPPEGHRYDKDVIEATPDQFDEQMRMLKKRHAVVGPEELLAIVENPKTLRSLRVAITFDDGYRDNYTFAFPILKSHGLAASFFLPTQFVGTRKLTWWDQIANAVRRCAKDELRLRYPRPLDVRVDRDDPDDAIRTVLRAYTRDPSVELSRFLAEVERACELALASESEDPQFMSWDEAAEMEREGMGIGSHTHSHQVLANLAGDEQRKECVDSRTILEEKKLSALALAYPVGKRDSFTSTTIAHAKDAGYRYAVSNYGGINLPETMDPFDVRRLGMNLDIGIAELRLRLALTGLGRREPW